VDWKSFGECRHHRISLNEEGVTILNADNQTVGLFPYKDVIKCHISPKVPNELELHILEHTSVLKFETKPVRKFYN
jgi:hypothetical protein